MSKEDQHNQLNMEFKDIYAPSILIGELMPALVLSPLLVCFTGTIFARRVPMNPRKKSTLWLVIFSWS
jgi:hypothetical protein